MESYSYYGRNHYKANLTAAEFVQGVLQGLGENLPESGYGMTAGFVKASREDLDKAFHMMNPD